LLGLLHNRFSCEGAEIDTVTYNPGRLVRVYGTLNMKGGDTPDRPMRLSSIQDNDIDHHRASDILSLCLEIPEIREQPAPPQLLDDPQSKHQAGIKITPYTQQVIKVLQDNGLYKKSLGEGKHGIKCPWSSQHTTISNVSSTAIIITKDGNFIFKCQHRHCDNRTHKDLLRFLKEKVKDSDLSLDGLQNPGWDQPLDLPKATPTIPPFPKALLPLVLRDWVIDTSDRLQVPREMVAAPLMVSLGALIGKKVGIAPKKHDDWVVIATLWGMVIAPPGTLKTPTLGEALSYLKTIEKMERDRASSIKQELERELEILEAEITAAKKKLKKDDLEGKEALTELLQRRDELKLELKPKRYILNDATIEKIADLLESNPNGLLVVRDEILGLISSFNKTGHEPDRQFYLESWSGTGSFYIDRITREGSYVENLILSLYGGLQPDRLATLIKKMMQGKDGDDGFLQRFQLGIYPEILDQWELVDRPPNEEARSKIEELFSKITEDGFCSQGATLNQRTGIPFLRFDPNAQQIFNEWYTNLNRRIRSDDLRQTPLLASHLSKFSKLIPSLALIFHIVNKASSPDSGDLVTQESVECAIKWGDFLELHAMKIYAISTHGDIIAADKLARKILSGEVSDGDKVRIIYRHHWQGLSNKDDVEEALSVLEHCRWLKTEMVYPLEGGRPSEVVKLNPAIIDRVTSSSKVKA